LAPGAEGAKDIQPYRGDKLCLSGESLNTDRRGRIAACARLRRRHDLRRWQDTCIKCCLPGHYPHSVPPPDAPIERGNILIATGPRKSLDQLDKLAGGCWACTARLHR
jgi:hypothetical protein